MEIITFHNHKKLSKEMRSAKMQTSSNLLLKQLKLKKLQNKLSKVQAVAADVVSDEVEEASTQVEGSTNCKDT